MTKKEMQERIEYLQEGIMNLGYWASEANYMGMYDEEEGAMQMQSKYFEEKRFLQSKIKEIEKLEEELDLAEMVGDYEKVHYRRLDIKEIEDSVESK